jgi:prevent-host-death family protein
LKKSAKKLLLLGDVETTRVKTYKSFLVLFFKKELLALANLFSYLTVMETVTIHTAKSTLSQLVARAEAGEEIVIARGAVPVAKLVPLRSRPVKREFGALKGVVSVGPEFFDPLPEEELAGWE